MIALKKVKKQLSIQTALKKTQPDLSFQPDFCSTKVIDAGFYFNPISAAGR